MYLGWTSSCNVQFKVCAVCEQDGLYLLSFSNGSWKTGGEEGKGNSATNSGLPEHHIDSSSTAQSKFMLSDWYLQVGGVWMYSPSGGSTALHYTQFETIVEVRGMQSGICQRAFIYNFG